MKTKSKWPFLALLLSLLPAFAPNTAHAALFGLSQQDEIAAGKEVTKQALKEYGGAMPANHPYSKRVRAIGAQLARLSTRKGIPYSYTVLNDTKVLNAFAAPGGPIFVTRKLVETASNDAELAYVLGHETGHIERKHIVKQVEQQQKAGLIVGILGALFGKGGNSDAIGAIANVGWTALSRGYSRQDENEADAVGVRFMSQLGYDPRAALTMLSKLDTGGSGGVSKYLATHPAPKDRQTKVRAQIQNEKLVDVAKRHGGPRLAYTNESDSRYARVSDEDRYPGDSDDAAAYYPPDSDVAGAYYPPASSSSLDNELYFGAPIRLLAIGNGTNGVVMAPVNGFARWAGATVNIDSSSTITVRRGPNWLEIRRDSSQAKLNGRTVTMSAPATSLDNTLYAPLGHLASGVGATATLDQGARIVRISFDGRSGGFVRLPA